MSLEDKYIDQARAYEVLDDWEARPLAGAGRWSTIPGGRLYTNDANILFLEGDGSATASGIYAELDKAFQNGETATSTFNRLAQGTITTGDLSELA